MNILEEFATAFAKEYEGTVSMLPSGFGGTIQIGPVGIRMAWQQESDMLVLQCPVTIVPAEKREAFALYLLEANDLLMQTHGFTLGVNMAAEVVTLQLVWEMKHLEQPGFNNLVLNLIKEANDWAGKIDTWETDTGTQDKELPKETQNWIPM